MDSKLTPDEVVEGLNRHFEKMYGGPDEEHKRLRGLAWDWVDTYRRIMWEAYNPTPGLDINYDMEAMTPAALAEPLRSAVKELLQTFPPNWFERERLETYKE